MSSAKGALLREHLTRMGVDPAIFREDSVTGRDGEGEFHFATGVQEDGGVSFGSGTSGELWTLTPDAAEDLGRVLIAAASRARTLPRLPCGCGAL